MAVSTSHGIYYFLGNISSHVIHALPLYEELGGTFVVLSESTRRELEPYDLPVLVVRDLPQEFLKLTARTRSTMEFLDHNAQVVVFYELFKFSRRARIRRAKTIFLSHGNGLKRYMSMNRMRLKAVNDYDHVAALGPFQKSRLIDEDGVDPRLLVDLGIARTDELVRVGGQVDVSAAMSEELCLDPTRPVVSYIPTYWGASSVHQVGQEIVRNIPDHYTLIVRPHPQTPQDLIDEYIRLIDEKPNVVFAPLGRFVNADLVSVLRASSLIIGDVSSVMIESLLLDRPLIFARDANHDDEADLAPISSLVSFAGQIDLGNVGDLPRLLDSSIAKGIDAEVWRATKDLMFFHHDGTSVREIARFIRSLAVG